MSSMYNLAGWSEVDCAEADRVRAAQQVSPGSGLTDLDGEYGEAVIYREWWDEGDRPVLRDYLWHPHTDDSWCVHHVPEGRVS